MADQKLFTVRPTSKQPRNDYRNTFRVQLSPSSLVQLKLHVGDLCQLQLSSSCTSSPNVPTAVNDAAGAGEDDVQWRGSVIAWTAAERIHDTVVQTTKQLQDLYGLRLGDKVSIIPSPYPLEQIEKVRLEEISTESSSSRPPSRSRSAPVNTGHDGDLGADRPHWEWALAHPLSKCEVVAEGLVFDIELKGAKKRFRVAEIDCGKQSNSNSIFKFTDQSNVLIGPARLRQDSDSETARRLELGSDGLGGLGSQIAQINERLQDFNTQKHNIIMPSFYRGTGGILIYGGKGTGKSLLMSKIADLPWQRTFDITSTTLNSNTGSSGMAGALRKIFADALKCQPSLISIDQLDALAPKSGSGGASALSAASMDSFLSPALCEALDSLQNSKVLVVACTRRPNDVDDTLRSPHRFGTEIELPVPTAKDRLEILLAIRGTEEQPLEDILKEVSVQTHGYVGADLVSLLETSCRKAKNRLLATHESTMEEEPLQNHVGEAEDKTTDKKSGVPSVDDGVTSEEAGIPLTIIESDLFLALQEIRPTAMREVFLETPSVRWNDIGGQRDIKRCLQRLVSRPIRNPGRLKQLNAKGKKGILLYGPPGCSKTLIAKALATEAGLNFLAVKGAEILSMYVGESERALREIFRKARAASPSIVFFDEIDAIASKRSDTGSSGSGVNVLTTLLNEMDGIEELKNVLVLAATNKPMALDPALMRPGRLDNILYIGPPDLEARKEIFEIWLDKSYIDDEVDPILLAAKTAGHTGAELVGICESAAEFCMDEEENGKSVGQPINNEHFDMALALAKKQTPPNVIEQYIDWGNSYGTQNLMLP